MSGDKQEISFGYNVMAFVLTVLGLILLFVPGCSVIVAIGSTTGRSDLAFAVAVILAVGTAIVVAIKTDIPGVRWAIITVLVLPILFLLASWV